MDRASDEEILDQESMERIAAEAGSTGRATPIVGVGSSAGGLEALREMFAAVDGPTGLAFVVVQHLDPNHESLLAQLLARETRMAVQQAAGGETPQPDHVYIIPPGRGLALRDGKLELTDFAQPRGMRRPIDDFFESLAQHSQQLSAGVIVSGTGADGAVGLRAIKEHGGLALAQEPGSARYDGMPLAAVSTGLVDFVRPAGDLVRCLSDYFKRRLGQEQADHDEAALVADHVDELCRVLRDAVGHDFSGYKRSTLERRIMRRMQVLGIEEGERYLARLRHDRDECDALLRDLLINVTRFFRDADAFAVLRTEAIDPLVKACEGKAGSEIRVWVPGCSSGEEAYSIAMMFADACERRGVDPLIQIFATDIDERMLQIAREAQYPAASLSDVPEAMRAKFIHAQGDHFIVAPQLRDMVRFSNHSIIKDPPFARLDLISCRNLLIYFGDRLQQGVLPLMHYALREDGFLFLGPSETIGRFEDLFEPIDARARLFSRRPGKARYPVELPAAGARRAAAGTSGTGRSSRRQMDDDPAVQRLVARYSPAAMVVDRLGVVKQSFGRLSRYFEFPGTQPGGVSATSLARSGLRDVLANLLKQSQKNTARLIARDVTVRSEFGSQRINVIAEPLPDELTLFVFRETAPFVAEVDDDLVEMGPNDAAANLLEDELRITRHRLRLTIEELETVNEELKSSNEEMMSMNEELQSTNEELTTVNDELKTKLDQLTVANADLRNFFESTQLAVVILDSNLNVRNFTEAATELFPLKPGDRGRSLAEITTRVQDAQYLTDAKAVIGGQPSIQRMVESDGDRSYVLRVMPYRTSDGIVSGATLVFSDVTDLLALEAELADERERLELAIEVASIGVWEYAVDEEQVELDETVAKLFDFDGPGMQPLDDVLGRIHSEDRPAVEASLRRGIAGESDYSATFRIVRRDGRVSTLRGRGRLVGTGPAKMVGVNFDMSSEAEAAAMRELMLREMNHRVKNLFSIIGGMIGLAARDAEDVTDLAMSMRQRIEALGRAHSLTNDIERHARSDLKGLLEALLEPYADHGGISIDGPEHPLQTHCLSSLALLFHEWATNAAKYGALSSPGGTLSITWTEQADGMTRLAWVEQVDQSRVVAGSGSGFGTKLAAATAQQLDATFEREHDGTSYRITLMLPRSCFA